MAVLPAAVRAAALDFGGQCIMEQPLPDYPVARIRTGQFTPEGDQIWMAEFPVAPQQYLSEAESGDIYGAKEPR